MNALENPIFLDLSDSFFIVATSESTQVQVFMIVCQTFFVMLLQIHNQNS